MSWKIDEKSRGCAHILYGYAGRKKLGDIGIILSVFSAEAP
jgi:hypothetical protein